MQQVVRQFLIFRIHNVMFVIHLQTVYTNFAFTLHILKIVIRSFFTCIPSPIKVVLPDESDVHRCIGKAEVPDSITSFRHTKLAFDRRPK